MARPNVLILMCDQMQAKRMGFVDGIAHTPNLDALAAEGVHFTNAVTIHGQCVPSRVGFATGMSPHECNVMCNFGFHGHCGTLTPTSRTFFHDFEEAGYTTALFGKSHMGPPLSDLGFMVGQCLDGHFPEGKEPEFRVKHRERLKSIGGDPVVKTKGAHHAYLADGLDWLREHEPAEGPLLFFFNTNLPHPPFYWEEEWKDMFKPEEIKLPRSFYEETFEGKPEYIRKRQVCDAQSKAGQELFRQDTAQYYTMISAVDKACGQIIDVFKEKGMWDNTVVLFFTDHGDMMGGHRLRFKGNYPYEELYNIPCIMKLPKGLERRRAVIEEPIISTELPGALLELAGLEAKGSFAGSGVIRALNSDAPTGDECVFFEHYAAWWGIHPFYAARTATMKYVRYYGEEGFEELYDLASDPDELRNVAKDPAYAEQYKDLSERADSWWKETGGQSAEYYETEEFKEGLNK